MPKRTSDEIKNAFHIQVEALKSSCAAYDGGAIWESRRLATAIYVLLYDGGKRNVSILTQLGIREGLKYVSTAVNDIPRNILAWHPLVLLRMSSQGSRYVPVLGDRPEPPAHVSVQRWWDRDV